MLIVVGVAVGGFCPNHKQVLPKVIKNTCVKFGIDIFNDVEMVCKRTDGRTISTMSVLRCYKHLHKLNIP